MVLVFSIFFIIILGLVFSKIKIDIKEIIISNNKKKFKIEIYFYFFCILKILSIKIDSKNIKIYNHKINIQKLNKKIIEKLDVTRIENNIFRRITLKDLKKLKINISSLKIYFEYSTNNIWLTTYSTPIISTFISMIYLKFIKKYNSENYYFKINPMYLHKKYFYVEGESIIEVKMVHIISTMYQLLKKASCNK